MDSNDTCFSINTSNANKFNFVGYTTNMFWINVLCWMGVRVIFIVPNSHIHAMRNNTVFIWIGAIKSNCSEIPNDCG